MDSSASPDKTWLIASCPGCSRQIKARKEILQSNLAIECPHCKSPLNLTGIGNSKEPQYAKAEQSTGNTTGTRRRRRSKKTKLIAWDIEESDEEGEGTDQTGNESKVRSRRVRKNKQS